MEVESSKPPIVRSRSIKSIVKFCLTYFASLLILALIFTALNCEKMSKTQSTWRWGFVISLIASGSMSITALLILFYTDFYTASDTEIQTAEKNVEVQKPPEIQENSESGQSFKTVMTIISQPEDLSKKQIEPPQSPEPKIDVPVKLLVAPKFYNLTPGVRSQPVTVVDLPALNAKRRRDRQMERDRMPQMRGADENWGQDELDAKRRNARQTNRITRKSPR